MKRHDIRLRKQEFSASRIRQHKDYKQLMRQHHRSSRNKTVIQTVAVVVLVIVISGIFYLKSSSRFNQNPAVESPSIKHETIQQPVPEKYKDRVLHVVGATATPSIGWEEYGLFLQENISYPALAKNTGVEGVVKVQILVTKTGDLGEFRILEGLGAGCDEEAIRLIKEGPKWIAGEINGEPDDGAMVIPVYFKLK